MKNRDLFRQIKMLRDIIPTAVLKIYPDQRYKLNMLAISKYCWKSDFSMD